MGLELASGQKGTASVLVVTAKGAAPRVISVTRSKLGRSLARADTITAPGGRILPISPCIFIRRDRAFPLAGNCRKNQILQFADAWVLADPRPRSSPPSPVDFKLARVRARGVPTLGAATSGRTMTAPARAHRKQSCLRSYGTANTRARTWSNRNGSQDWISMGWKSGSATGN